ncbi:MAG: DUF6339 family protein [Anaerolineae bacterium]
MSQPLRRLIPQARTLITKESFRDQSFGNLEGYVQDLRRPIDLAPLVRVVHRAMSKYPRQREESDGWLAPRVHASLRLFRSEAADQGIWDYLSVVVLRDYVLWRMAGEDGLVNDMDRIVGPFRHQAVARLWWAAELSRNGADYSPTGKAFRSQDAVNYLTNVDAFHNRPAALAYIRFISHKSGTKPIKQMAIETGKTLNHVLTTIVLDSFAPDSGSDMNAQERWIAEPPDVTLVDSALPQGPDEPQVPEEKIYAVEQLLERLMEEHRWRKVVDWTAQWIEAAQSPEPAETALPIIPGPGGNGAKDAVEKGVVAQDAVLYERFAEALRDDLGVEPSDQTRTLFEKVLKENGPEFKGYAESDGRRAAIAETAESVYRKMSPEQQTIARRIYLRLTEAGEGSSDGTPVDTRRGTAISELISHPEDAPAVDAVLKMLAEAHLISTKGGAVKVADEAGIREWRTLREWLNEDREGLRLRHPLVQAAQESETLSLYPVELYRGAPLTQAAGWVARQEPDLNADELKTPERVFPGASKDLAERAHAESKEQNSESEAAQRFAAAERQFIEAAAVYFGD